MIEVACYRPAHGSFISNTAALRVSALAEVRKVAHQQNPERIGVVEQHWIVDLEVHAQQVEAYTIRVGNVVTERLCITGCVNAVGIVGLVKRAAQINRFAVQAQCSRCSGSFHRFGRKTPHSEIAVNDIVDLIAMQLKPNRVQLRQTCIP